MSKSLPTTRPKNTVQRAALIALAAGSFLALTAIAGPPTFTLTGTAGSDSNNVFGAVNFDGGSIVGFGTPGFGFNGRGTLWNYSSGLNPISLGLAPGATFSDAEHITGDGLTAFGRGSTGTWVYTVPGPIVALPGGTLTDISRDGTRKLWNGFFSPGRQVDAGPIVLLPLVSPALPEVQGVAISPDGDQIAGYGRNVTPGGGYGDPDIVEELAAVWSADTNTWTHIGGLAGDKSRAIRISEDGSVVVGESDAFDPNFELITRAWIKVGSGPLVDLTSAVSEELPGRVLDMSDDGSVVLMTVGSVEYLWDAANGPREVRDVLRTLNHLPVNMPGISFEALSGNGRYVAGDVVTEDFDLIAFTCPIVDACPVPTNGEPDATEILIKSGDLVPGLPGPTVSGIQQASIGEGGTVAIRLFASGSPVLLSGVPGISWTPVCTLAGASPVPGQTFSTVGNANAKFGESAGFFAQLAPSITQGVFIGSPSGGVSMAARSGDPVPTLGVNYSFSLLFAGPLFNNVGEAAFFSGITGGNFYLYFAGAPGGVKPIFVNTATRAEFPTGAAITTPVLMGFNDKGQILLTERIVDASVPTSADEVLSVVTPDSAASQIRVGEGRQVPDRPTGVVFGSLDTGAGTTFDRDGRVAFVNTPSDGLRGLFVESDLGLGSVLNKDDELPGLPGAIVQNFSNFALDDRRGVVAGVSYILGGDTGQAVWASNTAGFGARLLAKTGDVAPDVSPCSVINSVAVLAANRNQQVLLSVGVTGLSNLPGFNALYLHDRVRGLVKLTQIGMPVEIGPGDTRIVSAFSPLSATTNSPSDGKASWLDHLGNAITILQFTDGTEAVVRFRVNPTAFPCPADFNGDGLVDDNDFVNFAVAYNDVIVPPADGVCDVNTDGVVDDLDFTVFAAAYNDLLCP